MNHDNYDMQMLKAIQRIAKSLEIIANNIEPNAKAEKTDKMINPYQE